MITTEQLTASRPTTWRTRSAFWWIFLSALAIAVLAPLPYLTSSLQSLTHNDSQLAANYVERPVGIQLAFYLHIGFGGLALLLSPLQFAARLRARVPRLHRASAGSRSARSRSPGAPASSSPRGAWPARWGPPVSGHWPSCGLVSPEPRSGRSAAGTSPATGAGRSGHSP